MNVNKACHSQPAFKQGGTIAEHPVHRPRMPLPCADRTRRCLFFFSSLHHHPPLSFSGDDARLRHTCFSPLGSGLSVIPPGFPQPSLRYSDRAASSREALPQTELPVSAVDPLYILLFLLPALGEGCRGWKPALVASSWTRS